METASLRSSPTMRFLGGVGVMLLSITVGSWLIYYMLVLIQVGLILPWQPVDKNIGVGAGIIGGIGGHMLGLVVLAVVSSARRDAKPFLGGLAGLALGWMFMWIISSMGIV